MAIPHRTAALPKSSPAPEIAPEPVAPAGACAEIDFAGLLEETRRHVDRVLKRWPDGLAETRRVVIEHFWPSPRPEELQTIVRIAGDASIEGARSETCRTLIALRILADRETAAFWDAPLDGAAELRRRAESFRGILSALGEIDDAISLAEGGMGPLGVEDPETMRLAMANLAPALEPVRAAALLAPRLADLLDASAADNPRAMIPSLTDDEVRLLRQSSADAAHPALHRNGLEVAALRWMLYETVAAWETSAAPEFAAGGTPGERPADPQGEAGLEDELRVRVQEEEALYSFISNRLQKLQDGALMARRKEEADWLFRFRRPLSASHTKLVPILHGLRAPGRVTPGSSGGGPRGEPTGIEVKDGEVEAIFQKAVTEPAAPVAETASSEMTRTEGKRTLRRTLWLSALAATLLIIAVALHFLLPKGPPAPIAFSPQDSASLKLVAAKSIGSMLYAQVSYGWSGLPERERLRQINELVLIAKQRGFQAVHLVDQDREPVADWDRTRGVELAAPGGRPAAPVPGSAAHTPTPTPQR